MDIFMFLILPVILFIFSLLLMAWQIGWDTSFITDMLASVPLLPFILLFILFGLVFGSITGFISLPYVFVYYEYRARYENYSEELLAEEMGYQPMEEMMNV
jgi:hypothetical protein